MVIRRVRVALVAFASLAVMAACSNNGATWQEPPAPPPNPPAELVFSHDANATDVSPGKPVTVAVYNGTLETVSLSSNIGEVPGLFAQDRTTWRTAQDLEFGKSYTLTVSSLGLDGKAVEASRTFTTIDVARGFYWNVFLSTANNFYGVPLDGGTFGVGQPIVASFDDAVDPKIAEATLSVETTPAVEGSWWWKSDREAHWRPKPVDGQVYWKAGTQVTVRARILGVELTSPDGGRVLHGQENKTATFTIGSSKIAKIDNNTHQMTVYIDGTVARTIPVSLGKNGGTNAAGQWLDWRTTSGVHIVTEKHNPVLMKPAGLDPVKDGPSGTNLYYEELIDYAVRISDDGIYVHSAPWSEWAQGSSNQSHGCVNIAGGVAPWFYDTFDRGDVVEIVNTGKDLQRWDGLTDWNIPWDEWVAGSAL